MKNNKELTNKDFKCKNHVYISDYTPDSMPQGFGGYGMFVQAGLYVWHLPKLFLHQVVCPDNPMLHAKSVENYEKYDKHLGDLSNVYKITEKFTMQIYRTKKKTLSFISI